MLKSKKRQILGILALCAVFGVCAAQPGDRAEVPEESTKEQGMTIQKGESSQILYTEALEKLNESSGTAKYTTVRRGDFITTETVKGEVIYPKQERIRYEFPYGNTFFMAAVGVENPIKQSGDVIARIYVEIDKIELLTLERQLQRMEERGDTGTAYEELKNTLAEMQEATMKTEIVLEEGGYLLEQEFPRFESQITSYSIVVADLKERLIRVPNENAQFRYGQRVTVTAKINGVTESGTGTVISASPNTVSEELAGTTALVRLDEECEHLYGGADIFVTVETVHMEDVLLLDASATYVENGMQMVKIKDEYGLHAVDFSFGRMSTSTSTYWVIDGLEEGAEILIQ